MKKCDSLLSLSLSRDALTSRHYKQQKNTKSSLGFTIVELLVVIVVIGILAAITIVSYTGISQKAIVASLQSDLSNASKQLSIYQVVNGSYPTGLDASKCFVPASDNMCLKPSGTNSYDYQSDNGANPQTFSLTSTNGTVNYRVFNGSQPTKVSMICPLGFIVVPGSSTYGTSDFCVMKYEAKPASATVPISRASDLPWTFRTQTDAINYSPNVVGCTDCHLITEAEWLTIAQNVISVPSNWSGGVVGSGYLYSGHNDYSPFDALAADVNDNNGYANTGNYSGDSSISHSMTGDSQRRTLTLTNGEVIWDLSGNSREWTSGQTTGGQPGITGTGLAYREWNAVTNNGSLTVNPFPVFGTPAASGWNYAQGIGQIYSNTEDGVLRGFLRSGNFDNSTHAGIYTLVLNTSPSTSWHYQTFRVAK